MGEVVFVLAASRSGQFLRCSDLLTMPRHAMSLSYNIKRARNQPFFAVCLCERAKKCMCDEVALHYCSCFDIIYTLLYEIAVDLWHFFPQQTVLHCETIQRGTLNVIARRLWCSYWVEQCACFHIVQLSIGLESFLSVSALWLCMVACACFA